MLEPFYIIQPGMWGPPKDARLEKPANLMFILWR